MKNEFKSLKTVRDLIRYAVSEFNRAQLFFGHGTDNAYDEAVFLVLHSLNLPIDELEPWLEARVLPSEKAQCLALIKQRAEERIPLAYLTGETWLQGYKFFTDPQVIVPRSPIAELLTQHLEPWITEQDQVFNVLDMCTGSGCLAIIAAHMFPCAFVDGVDISKEAINLANRNVQAHGLDDRVRIVKSDLFTSLEKTRYDLILCNPPYVNADSMQNLPNEYKHEPDLALAGGEDGMDLIRKILTSAADYLTDNGFIVLEIGNEYQYFVQAFPSLAPEWIDTEGTQENILLLSREDLINLEGK